MPQRVLALGAASVLLQATNDVARLHVAVDGAVAMGEPEGGGRIGGDLGGAIGMEVALGGQDVGQAAALDVLHDDEVGVLVGAPVVHRHHARVVQVGRRLGLTTEPGHEGRLGRVLGEQDLDRDRTIQEPFRMLLNRLKIG